MQKIKSQASVCIDKFPGPKKPHLIKIKWSLPKRFVEWYILSHIVGSKLHDNRIILLFKETGK